METTRHDVRRQCATHAVYRPIPEDGDILLKITKRLRVTSTGDEISKYDNNLRHNLNLWHRKKIKLSAE